MLHEPGHEHHVKVVNGHQQKVEAVINATNNHIVFKAGGHIIEQICVAVPVNTRTDSHINIRASI